MGVAVEVCKAFGGEAIATVEAYPEERVGDVSDHLVIDGRVLVSNGFKCCLDDTSAQRNWPRDAPPPPTHWTSTIIDYTFYKHLKVQGMYVGQTWMSDHLPLIYSILLGVAVEVRKAFGGEACPSISRIFEQLSNKVFENIMRDPFERRIVLQPGEEGFQVKVEPEESEEEDMKEEADILNDELRIDPDDDMPRTMADMKHRYAKTYNESEIEFYFLNVCQSVPSNGQEEELHGTKEEVRIDPDDDMPRTMADMKHRYAKTYNESEIEYYFLNVCQSVPSNGQEKELHGTNEEAGEEIKDMKDMKEEDVKEDMKDIKIKDMKEEDVKPKLLLSVKAKGPPKAPEEDAELSGIPPPPWMPIPNDEQPQHPQSADDDHVKQEKHFWKRKDLPQMSLEDQKEFKARRQENKRRREKEEKERLKRLEAENRKMKIELSEIHSGCRFLILNLCFVT